MKFCKASLSDCQKASEIVQQRQEWFISNNIPQWHNITDYYNNEYYMSVVDKMYVLKDDNDELKAFCLIFFEDGFWEKDENSIYIHSFVSQIGFNGACKIFVENLKKIFKHKLHLRIDCLASNKKLVQIYTNQGFKWLKTSYYGDGRPAALLQYDFNNL